MTIGFKVCGKISKRGKHPFCHIETRLKFLTMLWEVNSRTFKDTFLKICFFPGISRIFKEISKIQRSSRKFKNVATMKIVSHAYISPYPYCIVTHLTSSPPCRYDETTFKKGLQSIYNAME